MGSESESSLGLDLERSRLPWHIDRVKRRWVDGERVAPVTVDMALTQACDYLCRYCYGKLQANPGGPLSESEIVETLTDMAILGVKAVSFVSDGESTLNPHWKTAILTARRLGLDVGLGTNGYRFEPDPDVIAALTYLRFNVSAFDEDEYQQIHGAPADGWRRVWDVIRRSLLVRAVSGARVTIGVQQVYLPGLSEQTAKLAQVCRILGVDYLQVKHCSDDENGSLGIDHAQIVAELPELLEIRDRYEAPGFRVIVKEAKIRAGSTRTYSRCRAPIFHLQISGSGLVAPCGMLFSPRYERFHIGNLHREGFGEILRSERYWDVMTTLAGPSFDAKTMCGCLCLQDASNRFLEDVAMGRVPMSCPTGSPPLHLNFL